MDLILDDVDASLGPDAVRVVILDEPGAADQLAIENPSLLGLATSGRWAGDAPFDGTDILIYVPGEMTARSNRIPLGEPFSAIVERVVDLVQGEIVESKTHFGSAFPLCPRHGGHPMWAEARGSRALWVCHADPDVVVPVGQLRDSDEHRSDGSRPGIGS